MALIQVEFLSKALKRTVTFQTIIPADRIMLGNNPEPEQKTFRTLYLLHLFSAIVILTG
jgi:putative tributyrin esterase